MHNGSAKFCGIPHQDTRSYDDYLNLLFFAVFAIQLNKMRLFQKLVMISIKLLTHSLRISIATADMNSIPVTYVANLSCFKDNSSVPIEAIDCVSYKFLRPVRAELQLRCSRYFDVYERLQNASASLSKIHGKRYEKGVFLLTSMRLACRANKSASILITNQFQSLYRLIRAHVGCSAVVLHLICVL